MPPLGVLWVAQMIQPDSETASWGTDALSRASLLTLTLGVLIIVGVVPLLLDLPRLDHTYYAPKARALYILTPVLAVAWATWIICDRQWDRLALVAAGMFVAAAAAATALSVNPQWSLRGASWRNEGLGAYLGYAAVFLASVVVGRAGRGRMWATAALLGGTLAAGYGVAQYLGYEWLVRDSQRLGWFQAFSTSGNPNFLGAYMVLLMPLAAAAALSARRTATLVCCSFAAGVIYLAVLCTYSRSAWVALAGAVLLFGALLVIQLRNVRMGRVLALAGVLAGITIAFLIPGGPLAPRAEYINPVARARSVLELQSSGVRARPYLWTHAVTLLAKRPILGYGPETLALVFPQDWNAEKQALFGEFPLTIDKAHNDTLDLAMSVGVLGVLAFWSVLGLSLRRGWRAAGAGGPHALLASALTVGIAAYWFDLQFHFSVVSVAPVFWSALGILAGLPVGRDHHAA